jgi:hypothetical protein
MRPKPADGIHSAVHDQDLQPILAAFRRMDAHVRHMKYPGRKSGRTSRTPMNVFREGEDWIFALTYGSDASWSRT